jgi:hypothetical protein
MTPVPRKLLGRNAGMMTRESVYETPDGIEVDSREGYEVNRKRVLFEEVLLVTIHRGVGALYVVGLGFLGLVFVTIALNILLRSREPVFAFWFGVVALPFLAASIIRLVMKLDFVTVFGRRSKAVMRFAFRKRRAREVYGRICSRTLEVQRAMVEAEPAVQAPLDLGPLPPDFTPSESP